MCLTRVYENSHLTIITTVLGLEILPYVEPTTIDTELLLTYKSNMVQVDKYNDIKTSELDNNKVVQVISTSLHIFSVMKLWIIYLTNNPNLPNHPLNILRYLMKMQSVYLNLKYGRGLKIVYLIILRIGQLINKDGQLTWDLVVMQDWISVIFGWNWSSI